MLLSITRQHDNFVTNVVNSLDVSHSLLTDIGETQRLLNNWVLIENVSAKEKRSEIWKNDIHVNIDLLKKSLPNEKESIEKLRGIINGLEIKQWFVADVVHMPGNNKARDIYERKLSHIKEKIFSLISKYIEQIDKVKYKNTHHTLLVAADVRGHFTFADAKLIEFISSGNLTTLEKYNSSLKITNARVNHIVDESHSEFSLERKYIKDLSVLYLQYKKLALDIIAIRVSPTWNLARYILQEELIPLHNEVISIVKTVNSNTRQHTESESQNLVAVGNSLVVIFIILIGLLLWVMRGMAHRSTTSIVEPLVALDIATHKLADNILDHDIKVEGSAEVINLTKSFNDMRIKIKEQNDHLIYSNSKLDVANKAKDTFISSMSHEFRTPLNAIIGFSQLMALEDDKSNSDDKPIYIEIQHAGQKMLELFEAIQSVVDANDIDVKISEFNLSDALKVVVLSMQDKAASHQVELLLEPITDEIRSISTDINILKEILKNIIDNAIVFNRRAGKVRIYCELLEHHLRINIEDNGLGISASNMSHLFTPFDRLGQENVGPSGLGLGLAMSRLLAEKCNMKIGANCKDEEGCNFFIDIEI